MCDRCRTNNFTCSYSPSRRHGKQSWVKTIAEQQHMNSTMSISPMMTPSPLPLPPLYGTNDSSGYGLTPLGMTPRVPGTSHPGPPDQMMDVDGGEGQGADYSTLAGFDALGG